MGVDVTNSIFGGRQVTPGKLSPDFTTGSQEKEGHSLDTWNTHYLATQDWSNHRDDQREAASQRGRREYWVHLGERSQLGQCTRNSDKLLEVY